MVQKHPPKPLNRTVPPTPPHEVPAWRPPLLWGAAAALGPSFVTAQAANATCGSAGTLNATCGTQTCGWLDFSCTTTTEPQLQGLLLVLLIAALVWRHYVSHKYAKLPGFRRPF